MRTWWRDDTNNGAMLLIVSGELYRSLLQCIQRMILADANLQDELTVLYLEMVRIPRDGIGSPAV